MITLPNSGIALVLVGLVAGSVVAAQTAEPIQLSLAREYGRALYRDCRLTIGLTANQGNARLACTTSTTPSQQLRSERALTSEERSALTAFVGAADLCGGGHVGHDLRPIDGVLETLTASCPGGTVAVLVTSGNPTFSDSEPRRRLLERLHALQTELHQRAE